MTVHNIRSPEAFKEAIAKNPVVVIDFFATWCGPCKVLAPVIADISENEKYKDVHFAKFDVDDLSELAGELGIKSMPTLQMYKDGNKVDEVISPGRDALVQFIDKAL